MNGLTTMVMPKAKFTIEVEKDGEIVTISGEAPAVDLSCNAEIQPVYSEWAHFQPASQFVSNKTYRILLDNIVSYRMSIVKPHMKHEVRVKMFTTWEGQQIRPFTLLDIQRAAEDAGVSENTSCEVVRLRNEIGHSVETWAVFSWTEGEI